LQRIQIKNSHLVFEQQHFEFFACFEEEENEAIHPGEIYFGEFLFKRVFSFLKILKQFFINSDDENEEKSLCKKKNVKILIYSYCRK